MGSQANASSDLERAEHQDGAKKVLPFGYDESSQTHMQQAVGDILAHYQMANLDTASDPIYLGYLQADGAWYIKKISVSAGTVTYAKGASGYDWSERANATYAAFDTTF